MNKKFFYLGIVMVIVISAVCLTVIYNENTEIKAESVNTTELSNDSNIENGTDVNKNSNISFPISINGWNILSSLTLREI